MQVNILCNMAEVVVRLVEASWAQGAARAASATKLSRALSAYTVPLLAAPVPERQCGKAAWCADHTAATAAADVHAV